MHLVEAQKEQKKTRERKNEKPAMKQEVEVRSPGF